MKSARPQINLDVLMAIILAVCGAFAIGYLVGVDHCESSYKVRKMVAPRPTGVIDEKFIKQTVYRYSRSICKQRKEAGL